MTDDATPPSTSAGRAGPDRRARTRADRRAATPSGATARPRPTAPGSSAPRARAAAPAVPAVAVWFWCSSTRSAIPARRSSSTIPKGEGVSGIGDALAHRDVIGSSLAFSRLRPALRRRPAFQAGTYQLRKDLGVRERGRRARAAGRASTTRTLALPPGLTLARGRDAHRRAAGSARPRVRPSRDRPARSARSSSRPAPTRSRGSPGPTRTRSRTTRPRPTSCGRIVGAFDQHADRSSGSPAAADPYRDGDRRVADPGARPSVDEDRPLIAAVVENRLRAGHAAADRRDASSTRAVAAPAAHRRRLRARLAVQHLPGARACRRRRSRP